MEKINWDEIDYIGWALNSYDDWRYENNKEFNNKDMINFVILFLIHHIGYLKAIFLIHKYYPEYSIDNYNIAGYCEDSGQCSIFCHLYSNLGCKRAKATAAAYYKEVYPE